MTKNKMIHTRIDEDLHTKIFEKCNELGCTFSDFIITSLENSLENEPEIDENAQNTKFKKKPIKVLDLSKEIPKLKITKISRDGGKTWINL